MGVGVMVEMKVEDIAGAIKKMSPLDKEMLFLLLSGEGKEILKRVKEIRTGKIKPLTRDELMKNVL